jgi:hypothetical protein
LLSYTQTEPADTTVSVMVDLTFFPSIIPSEDASECQLIMPTRYNSPQSTTRVHHWNYRRYTAAMSGGMRYTQAI